jgi:hypothetical protein
MKQLFVVAIVVFLCLAAVGTQGATVQKSSRSATPGVVVTKPGVVVTEPAAPMQRQPASSGGEVFVSRNWVFELPRLVFALTDSGHIFETCLVVYNYGSAAARISPVVLHADGRANELVSEQFRSSLDSAMRATVGATGYELVPPGSRRRSCYGKEAQLRMVQKGVTTDVFSANGRLLLFADRPVHAFMYQYYHSDPWTDIVGSPVNCDGNRYGIEFICDLSVRALSGAGFR